jgi:hypothetical protein
MSPRWQVGYHTAFRCHHHLYMYVSSPQHAKWLMEETDEDGSSLIAIHKDRFDKLVTVLRTAVANEYKLDKEQTSYNDLLDAFRLSLQFYRGLRTKQMEEGCKVSRLNNPYRLSVQFSYQLAIIK